MKKHSTKRYVRFPYIFTICTSSEMMSETVILRLLVAAAVKIAAITTTNSN